MPEPASRCLLVAPTGGGKTLAGFLPSLIDLAAAPAPHKRPYRLHTLYISPLKALAVDVARNLGAPAAEMGLMLRIETRTGDTPPARRQRQRYAPPDILLTTPEQVALMLASKDAPRLFAASQGRGARRASCHPQFQARRSVWRWAWRGWNTWRPAIAASAFRPPSPIRRRCSAISCRSPKPAKRNPNW